MERENVENFSHEDEKGNKREGKFSLRGKDENSLSSLYQGQGGDGKMFPL